MKESPNTKSLISQNLLAKMNILTQTITKWYLQNSKNLDEQSPEAPRRFSNAENKSNKMREKILVKVYYK